MSEMSLDSRKASGVPPRYRTNCEDQRVIGGVFHRRWRMRVKKVNIMGRGWMSIPSKALRNKAIAAVTGNVMVGPEQRHEDRCLAPSRAMSINRRFP